MTNPERGPVAGRSEGGGAVVPGVSGAGNGPPSGAPKRARRRRRRHRRGPPGSSPGQIVVDPEGARTTVHVMAYGPDAHEESSGVSPAQLASWRGRRAVLWVDVRGLGDAAALGAVGAAFGLHHLALEDVVQSDQRPKVDIYEDQVFILLRALNPGGNLEQDSLFLGRDFVVTFQERPEDSFERVRQRLRDGHPRIRGSGADYLAYALLDTIVDGFFPVTEQQEERLANLEEEVVGGHGADTELVSRIHAVRTDLLGLRRAVLPLRELVHAFRGAAGNLLTPRTEVFLRDVADHAVSLAEAVESQRDFAKSLMDLHLSLVGQRTNEIIKVLTVITSIFIPLSFVASIYGMNFDPAASPWNMPELSAFFGYPTALALMLAISLGMLLWFRRRGWIGGRAAPPQGSKPPRPSA